MSNTLPPAINREFNRVDTPGFSTSTLYNWCRFAVASSADQDDVRFGAFEFEPRDRFIYTYKHVNNLAHDIRAESMVYLDESRLIPDQIGGKQLTDRDSWPLPELLFDRVDSENRQHKTLTTTKLPH